MKKDIQIIRELANTYTQISNSEENIKNINLHKKVNDLKAERPIVLIDEIPWHEMNINNELTVLCENPVLREYEWYFRTTIYKWKYMRADMVVRPYLGVEKIINSTGIGVSRIENEHPQNAKSYTFVDQFQCEEDLVKLHNEVITYDEKATKAKFEIVANSLGDILPVKITGHPTGYDLGCKTMDDIVNLRGLDTFFYDFIERPDFMHKLVDKLTGIFIDKVNQYNQLGLFDNDAYYIHGTSALTNDLKPDYSASTSKDVWGRGLAQIFASVSPEMHDEFDTQYMIKAMEPFGLVYYGCCEPLDKKIEILKQIPNLRKISITPWANVDAATEIMRNNYVVASKPNPSSVATSNLDETSVKKELDRIVSAIKRNGCSADIVLKDITTVCNNPQTLFKWHDIAMETVKNI